MSKGIKSSDEILNELYNSLNLPISPNLQKTQLKKCNITTTIENDTGDSVSSVGESSSDEMQSGSLMKTKNLEEGSDKSHKKKDKKKKRKKDKGSRSKSKKKKRRDSIKDEDDIKSKSSRSKKSTERESKSKRSRSRSFSSDKDHHWKYKSSDRSRSKSKLSSKSHHSRRSSSRSKDHYLSRSRSPSPYRENKNKSKKYRSPSLSISPPTIKYKRKRSKSRSFSPNKKETKDPLDIWKMTKLAALKKNPLATKLDLETIYLKDASTGKLDLKKENIESNKVKKENIESNKVKKENVESDKVKKENVECYKEKKENIETTKAKVEIIELDEDKMVNIKSNKNNNESNESVEHIPIPSVASEMSPNLPTSSKPIQDTIMTKMEFDLNDIPVPVKEDTNGHDTINDNKNKENGLPVKEKTKDEVKNKTIVIKSLKDSLVLQQAEEAFKKEKSIDNIDEGSDFLKEEKYEEINGTKVENQKENEMNCESENKSLIKDIEDSKETKKETIEDSCSKESKKESSTSKDNKKDKERKHSTSSKKSKKKRSKSRSRSRSRSRKRHKSRSRRSRSRSRTKRSRSKSRIKRSKSRSKRSRSRSRSRTKKGSYSRSKRRSYSRSRRSRSRSKRRRSRSRSHSHSRVSTKSKRKKSPDCVDSLRDKATRKRLLEVARKNAVYLMKNNCLPPIIEKESVKATGKSVEELTNYCKQLVAKEEFSDQDLSDPSLSPEEDEAPVDNPFSAGRHPFAIKDSKPIMMNIRNAPMIPTKTNAERLADTSKLREQFPVSSGSQHRTKEGWVIVEKDEKVVTKDTVFPEKKAEVDISSLVSTRLSAMRKLQDNPQDKDAIKALSSAQQEMQDWALSKQVPGQFTGSTGAKILSQEELAAGYQAWARKEQFKDANPVSSQFGLKMLQKMGWSPGEGLGKNKEGTIEPLQLDVKMDKRGLTAQQEMAPKRCPIPLAKSMAGKHPVSALVEICNKRKLGPPEFEMVFDGGPDHKKNFLMKVHVGNQIYQPAIAAPTKKIAKANAAAACLQALGLIPKDAPPKPSATLNTVSAPKNPPADANNPITNLQNILKGMKAMSSAQKKKIQAFAPGSTPATQNLSTTFCPADSNPSPGASGSTPPVQNFSSFGPNPPGDHLQNYTGFCPTPPGIGDGSQNYTSFVPTSSDGRDSSQNYSGFGPAPPGSGGGSTSQMSGMNLSQHDNHPGAPVTYPHSMGYYNNPTYDQRGQNQFSNYTSFQ